MKKLLLPIMMALVLSGCLNIDAHMKFREDGHVDTAMVMSVSKDMYELMNADGGENFCTGVGEKRSKHKDSVSCTIVGKTTIETMINGGFSFDVDPNANATTDTPVQVTEVGEGVLEIVVDFRKMMEDDPNNPEMNNPEMKALVRAAMANNHMSFGFTGQQIVSSTGTISNDGRTATIKVPMTDFIDKTAPEEFHTVLRYKDGGWLSMIMGWFYSIWPF
ncbi:MAG: hypothetical protein J4F41_09345 [Alphaproteobacteria bacterium]|nr:hypothetical protein [Alphaproteobacteria bacterium]